MERAQLVLLYPTNEVHLHLLHSLLLFLCNFHHHRYGVQLKCVQRNAGEKVPGCVGEGNELDGGLVSWDYCTNPVKVKQAADALAAQEIAQ